MRPGAKALSLLAVPLNLSLLQALAEEERPLTELRQAVGYPPASTMRVYLRALTQMGVVERKQEADFPGSVEFSITRAGSMLLAVGRTLQGWLDLAPAGPIALGSRGATSATKALVDGWSAGVVRALAARPFALTELHRIIPQLSYPSLERRLTAMRVIGQVEAQRDRSRGITPYKATEWLRRAVAPLTAATSWERRWIPDETRPVGRMDVEAAFLLAVPLLDLPPEIVGTCRLAVELRNGSGVDYAGVKVSIEEGRAASYLTRLDGEADAWATGAPGAWLRWGNGSSDTQIELGGEAPLARVVLEGLLTALAAGDHISQIQ